MILTQPAAEKITSTHTHNLPVLGQSGATDSRSEGIGPCYMEVEEYTSHTGECISHTRIYQKECGGKKEASALTFLLSPLSDKSWSLFPVTCRQVSRGGKKGQKHYSSGRSFTGIRGQGRSSFPDNLFYK